MPNSSVNQVKHSITQQVAYDLPGNPSQISWIGVVDLSLCNFASAYASCIWAGGTLLFSDLLVLQETKKSDMIHNKGIPKYHLLLVRCSLKALPRQSATE